MYIVTASFLRKVLLYSSLKNLSIYINKTPRYFNEILGKINEPSISTYAHPFGDSGSEVVEGTVSDNFKFSSMIFLNNKSYGFVKMRKRGRLKRKISKRLVSLNRVLD